MAGALLASRWVMKRSNMLSTARKTVPLFPIIPLVPLGMVLLNALALRSLFLRMRRLDARVA